MRHRCSSVVVAIGLGLAGVLTAAPASLAATTCTFETDLLYVEMHDQGDAAHLEIGGGGTILVNNGPTPVLCGPGGPPTVTNTETVAIVDSSDNPGTPAPTDGSGRVEVVEPSAFVPGATLTNENGGAGEIEFAVNLNAGSDDTFLLLGANPGDDNWVTGAGGINWNAGAADPAPDADLVTFSAFDHWAFAPRGGNDRVSARGGSGTGAVFPGRVEIGGDTGDDVLEGGEGAVGDQLDGGPGNDVIRGFGGDELLYSADGGDDTLDGGQGSDGLTYYGLPTGVTVDLSRTGPQGTVGAGIDTIAGVEDLDGTEHADTLIGNAEFNYLGGVQGDDTLDGGPGDDALTGGAGSDTVTYALAPVGVSVDLTSGNTSGFGNDGIADVENLIGSPFADTLIGSAEANALIGLGGADTISALAGPDTVDVRDGGRDAASCGSEIDSALADQQGVDAIDPDCETVAFAPANGGGGGPANGGGGAPSNQFGFGKAKRNKRTGTLKLKVIVPGPGGLELAKTKKVKGDDERAEAEGTVTLTVKPNGKAKQKLTNRGRAKVNAVVTYTPDGGTPNTEGKRLTLVKKTLAMKVRK